MLSNLTLPENIKISFVGPQGCGKSAIAKELQLLLQDSYGLDIPLFESDELLKQKFDMEIPQAFETYGPEKVRSCEGDIIRCFSLLNSGIFSSGGEAPFPICDSFKEKRVKYHSERNIVNLGNSFVVYPRPSESLEESIKICNWRISGAKDSGHRIALPEGTLEIRDPYYQEASDLIIHSKYGYPTNLAKDVLREYCTYSLQKN
jgi:shikimate kinase